MEAADKQLVLMLAGSAASHDRVERYTTGRHVDEVLFASLHGVDLDAVFIASDLMAHGALRTLRKADRRVPDDVAVIGFDDIEMARYTDPPLTTVCQPILDIGRQMTRQLLRLASGESVEPAVVLPTELILRESA